MRKLKLREINNIIQVWSRTRIWAHGSDLGATKLLTTMLLCLSNVLPYPQMLLKNCSWFFLFTSILQAGRTVVFVGKMGMRQTCYPTFSLVCIHWFVYILVDDALFPLRTVVSRISSVYSKTIGRNLKYKHKYILYF